MKKTFSKRNLAFARISNRRNQILASDDKISRDLMDILNRIQDLKNKIRGLELRLPSVEKSSPYDLNDAGMARRK